MTQPNATLLQRSAAFLLDFLLLALYLILLLAAGLLLNSALGPWPPPSPLALDAIAFGLTVLPAILYFALQHASPTGASWGKRRLGLRVVDLAGRRISLAQALLRAFLKFLPWHLAHLSLNRIPGWPFAPQPPAPAVVAGLVLAQLLVLLYLLSLAFMPGHRTLYDLASRTRVVQT